MAVLSLRSFHLVFVVIAIVLTAGFGVWGMLHAHATAGSVSLVLGALLILYGAYFAGRAERTHLR